MRKGKKREHCDSGWSKDGIDFYNEVRKRWKDNAFNNNLGVWSDLEKAWPDYAEENDFRNVYSRKKTRLELDTTDCEETQGGDLPVDLFCVRDEIDNCPWKAKRGEYDNGSDDENGCGRPWKRARDGRQHLLRVSTDCDLDSLFLDMSEESSDKENRLCPV